MQNRYANFTTKLILHNGLYQWRSREASAPTTHQHILLSHKTRVYVKI